MSGKANWHSGFISQDGGLLTSHLNIDSTMERHFSCLIQEHPEVTVFRLFLLQWFASPKKDLSK